MGALWVDEVVELGFAFVVVAGDPHHVAGIVADQARVRFIVGEGLAHPFGVVDAGAKDDGLAHRVVLVEEGTDLAGDGLVAVGEHDSAVDVHLVVDPVLDGLAVVVNLAFGRSPTSQVLVEVNADHLVGGEEPVVDALLERVRVDGFAEVVDVGDVLGFLRGGGQPDLGGGLEVLEDRSPFRIGSGASAVTLVDDDEVEEVSGKLVVDGFSVFTADDGLVER